MSEWKAPRQKKKSLFQQLCMKVTEYAFCEPRNEQSSDSVISLNRRALWLCKELGVEYEQQSELVHRIEYQGVHIQMVQTSESDTNVTMHFPTIGEDGKYLQCSWAFMYSKLTSFCTITAAIASAVIMADKYYGAPDENN